MRDTQMTPSTTLGILLMLAFCAFAPMMDAFAKATPAEIPVAQIVLVRFGLQVVLLYPLVWLMRLPREVSLRDVVFHAVRALTLIVATYCFFTAVRFMPLADAISIFFVSPFIVSLLGAVFLKEPIGWRRIIASLVGFGGALLVIRPSFTGLGAVALLPLATAALFASYVLKTRAMSQKVHPLVLQAHTALAAMLLTLPVLVLAEGSGNAWLDPVMPTGFALVTLAGVGIMATVSHVFLTFALRMAPAGLVSSLQYFEIIAAAALGYLVFGDLPTPLTVLGIAVIVASGLYTITRERRLERLSRQPQPMPPA